MTAKTTAVHYLGLEQTATLIRNREVCSREVTQLLLDRIARLDGQLCSYALVMAETALEQAAAADAEISAGHVRGPLHGVPIVVKDLCQIQGFPTGAGMKAGMYPVAAEDATVVQRLKEAGAVLLGKSQLTEGAYSDHHRSITPPRNPWNARYWPGISSSGSGVAIAAGLGYGSLASDTGGSIRWPAAANGVTGLKPTWGRVSRHGVIELAASLDHVGTMARSAVDAGILLGVIAGSDPKDPTALLAPVPDYLVATGGDLRGLRLGVDSAWNREGVDAVTQAALAEATQIFAELGAHIIPIRFPDVAQIVADWVPNCAIEAAVAHKAMYSARKQAYGSILASVIEAGLALSASEYQQILLRRMAFRGRVTHLFDSIDVLLTPAQPFAPLTLAQINTLGEQPGLVAMLQRYTCPFDMSGHPTLTMPAGFTQSGMPIGIQLVAGHLEETILVRAAAAFQSITDWHHRHPVA
ncbi:MAG: amidase [Advenella sp.]|uniref:amidase n=1 Tax=Advenella sp. TaxID=1872388 RepID=UPI003F9AE243